MYELKNGQMCIPAKALYEELGVISDAMYRNIEFRNKLEFVQRGGNGRQALVSFSSLPAHLKKLVVEKIGNPPEKQAISRIEHFYKDDVAVRNFFETYRLPDGRYLKAAAQDEYSINANMLYAIAATENETKLTRAAAGGTKRVDWGEIINTLKYLKGKKIDGEYPYRHTLPMSERRLRDALKKVKGGNLESLIPLGKYNNKNAAVVESEEQYYMLQEMLSSGRNLENKILSDMYNAAASALGWGTLTPAAISVWRKKLDHVTRAGRRGASNYNNELAMQNKRRRASAPLFFWSADGWTAELLYKSTRIDKKGNKVTTYDRRLTIVVILDNYNNYPIGYAIGDSETAELIQEAMRNAVKHTKELFGQMYRTWQIQTDNFQRKMLAPYWQALGEKWTPARVKNSKAKPIEPWFKHEMQKHCQLTEYNNWSGYGVTASKDKQVSEDWLNANRQMFPDKEGCRNQLHGIIEKIRSGLKADFVSAFNSLADSDKLPLSEELYLYKFGSKTEPNRLEGQGLTPRINGVEHFFDCFDYRFRDHNKERWVVHYDPDDTSHALAVAKDRDDLRFMVEEKYIQPMALKDRGENDAEQLNRVKEYNKSDRDYIIEERAKGAEIVQNILLNNKELNGGVLSKLLITDSKGQHKKYLFESATEVEFEQIGNDATEQEYLRSKTDFNKYLNQ
jgi:hypothetical protein